MALMIREFLDAKISEAHGTPLNLTEGAKFCDDPIDPDSLNVDIEGIHAYPHATRNYTRYMPKALKESIPSWTKPYRRPVIYHHNEADGRTIGRIIDAQYKTKDTLSGTPALVFTANIPGEEDKKAVTNGINTTTSIGVIAHDVRCSICGKPVITEDGCEEGHQRGVVYENPKTGENEVCYWDIYSMEAKELSYVIVPSDIYSKNINIYPATKSGAVKPQLSEGLDPSLPHPEKGENSKMTDLEKELTEAKAKLEKQVAELTEAKEKSEKAAKELTEAKETAEAQIKELTETKAKAEDSVKELTEAKEKAEAEIAELKEAKSALETQAAEEKTLKEGLETELADTKKALRESRIAEMQYLRKQTGHPELAKEVAESRSDDFIVESIIDMKEELSAKNPTKPAITEGANLPKPGDVKNPAFVEEPEITESAKKDAKDIDLKAGLESLFSGVLRSRF